MDGLRSVLLGKTAIVEGIAQRIVNDEVPETLTNRRVVQLDLGGIVAGTKYRDEFEERLKKVIDEITENQENIILFLDELHTLVGPARPKARWTPATC